MTDPLPCPCCNNEHLYVGTMSCDSVGVHCMRGTEETTVYWLIHSKKMKVDDLNHPEFQGCGLKLEIQIPSEYPEDFPEDLLGMDALDKLREMTLEEAIRRWNQRSPN